MHTLNESEKNLRALASRFFVNRIPFFPDFFFCAASVQSKYADRIDVAGVGREREQAVRSAYGEAVETLSQDMRNTDPILSAQSDAGECQGWFSDVPPKFRQRQVWAQGHDTQNAFKVPAVCVLRMNKSTDAIPPISEGAAAGPTPEFAKLAGMLELIERDSVARWWHGGQPARRISNAVFERVGEAPRQVLVLDLSHGSLAPVVAMISCCQQTKDCVFAAACRPSFSEAKLAALRELIQFEVAQISKRHTTQDAAVYKKQDEICSGGTMLDLAGPFNDMLETAQDLPTDQSSRVLEVLMSRAKQQNIRIGFVDLTRREFGLSVFKAMSPDLEPSRTQSISPSIASLQNTWGPPNPKRANVGLYW
ncbi:MAG: YcaO-like family protein [Paracoccaceae bacterium]